MTKKKKPKRKGKAKKKAKVKKKAKAKKARAVDRVASEIEQGLMGDTESVMFGGRGPSETKLVAMKETGKKELKEYFGRMALRCTKCKGNFDHDARIKPIVQELSCPSCNQDHVMKFKPASRLFKVHSKTVDIVDSKEGKGC